LSPAPSLIADLAEPAEQHEVVEAIVEKAIALRQTALSDLSRRADIAGGDTGLLRCRRDLEGIRLRQQANCRHLRVLPCDGIGMTL
jgi:hypothetical protein